jgi:hypothetical protein
MTETHPEKRIIGYPRASTYGQTFDSQLAQLRAAGCSSRNIASTVSKIEGNVTWLQQINRLPAAGGSTGSGR